MKIRKLTAENRNKVYALLRKTFPGSNYEVQLVEKLHKNEKLMHEWVCIHTNKVIAYIAFTAAYNGSRVCGFHLAPLAVSPEFQNRGIGTELLRFALRQKELQAGAVYVLGNGAFYRRFGFEHCPAVKCPFDKGGQHFFSMRNASSPPFTVGYEPEFKLG